MIDQILSYKLRKKNHLNKIKNIDKKQKNEKYVRSLLSLLLSLLPKQILKFQYQLFKQDKKQHNKMFTYLN